tara:strand:- start:6768 stop:7325 length:558 start_codon:yes stop_codon:yes gene_type:complete
MKVVIKSFIYLYVSVLVLFFSLLTRLIGFEPVVMRISQIPYKLGNQVRYKFYRKHLKSLGENVTFSFGCLVTNMNTVIGNNVRLGPYSTVGLAHLGDDIITAQHVHILSGSKQHSFVDREVPIWRQKGTIQCVELKGDNWIGANVVVMANVGYGTILGSGSIVATDVPEMCVAAGNPCKKLKDRP